MQGEAESELISAAIAGNQTAVQQLLTAEYDRIWAICRRVLGNNADADDAAQETMIRIVRSLPKFDQRSKFSTWAYRIASNCAIDETRRRARRRADSLDQPRPDGRQREIVDASAHNQIERIGDDEAFQAALATLDEDFRIPLVLRDLGTLSYAEIAQELGIPAGTVKSRIARGRRMLLEQLAGNQSPTPNVKPTSVEP